MLSQRIIKSIIFIDNNQNEQDEPSAFENLKELTYHFEKSQNYLQEQSDEIKINTTVDSLLKASEPYANVIITSGKDVLRDSDSLIIKNSLQNVKEAELPYSIIMNSISNEYLQNAEENLTKLQYTIYILALIAFLILLGEFLFVLVPAINQLFKKSKELLQSNNELSISENKLKSSMIELTKLKTDLETREEYNKILIEQAPTAISMLDKEMNYIAVSQQWIIDYKMEGQQIIGRSHYDIFPEIGDDWRENHQKCLNGAIDTCDEAPFTRADGSVQWIYWDVRPWYISEGEIGGLLMHTGDITESKEKDLDRIRIQKILDRTNEVARIGTWEVDLLKNKLFWSKVVCEIHGVPQDYEPDLETAINFYKEGKSRDTIRDAVKEAIDNGTSYDVEVELVTVSGTIVWTRAIGQAEFRDGKCIGLIGVFQDINNFKLAQQALNIAHTELKALLNSGPVAIISTNNKGMINHFNHGAEVLLGYSASEMIGKKEPEIFHIEEELDKFRVDIAKLYGADPHEFDPYLELANRNEYDTREWTYRRKDGSTFPVELTLTAIKDEQGKKIGFLGVSFDITERKKTENELLKKNHLLNFAEEITMIGHWQWDTIADNVQWSNNLYKMFDLKDKTIDLKFDSYFNFVHPDDKQLVTDNFQKAAADKNFYSFTHRIVTAKGKQKTVQLLGEVITNDKNEVVEMIGTGQDITELRMAENKFRGLLESAPDAMVIMNEKGKIQLINKQTEILFGYHIDELFDKSVKILIPARFTGNYNDISQHNGFFANPNVRAMGMEIGKDLFGINKQGNEIPIQISLSPLETEEGLLVSVAIRDITTQKLAERKIIQAKENLEVLTQHLSGQNKRLADFAHITSHNLRSPVTNLNALLHLYNISESDEERKLLFEKFEIVINHLTTTLNTLIEALKTKKISVKDLELVDFEETLNKTKEILSGQIIETNSIITSDFSQVPKIEYHKTYLESIFLNLVTNTIKYRSPDRNPEIHIETGIVDEKINLTIRDNGLGIDLVKHGHKLFGLNKTFHRHPDAKGVGLYLTKIQVETMKGSIFATSEVNKGSVFTIIFNNNSNEESL
ncbi:MAG: PAS domain S-box protein [Aequorivita antarctica]